MSLSKTDLAKRFGSDTLAALERRWPDIQAMYLKGDTLEVIGKKYGWSAMTLSRFLRYKGSSGLNYNGQELTKRQESIIRGTLFGDGNLAINPARGKNALLQFTHGLVQREYLQFKVTELSNIFRKQDVVPHRRSDGTDEVHASSRCSPHLTAIYNEYYIRPRHECTEHIFKKQLTEANLSKIDKDPLALAIWFMDDGTNAGSCLQLVVGGIYFEEAELCSNWLLYQGYPNTVIKVKDAQAWRLNFTKTASEALAANIDNHVIPSMKYKLGKFTTGVPMSNEVVLPEMTEEQERLLEERFKIKYGIGAKTEEVAAKAPVVAEEYIFTNPRNSDLSIDDLGIKSPNGQFRAETFGPYETKNLRRLYQKHEISKSKYLIEALDKGLLVRGSVDKASLQAQENDPGAALARNNPTGSFTDPLSLNYKGDTNPLYGQNEFDKKLQELEKRDEAEDRETRKG